MLSFMKTLECLDISWEDELGGCSRSARIFPETFGAGVWGTSLYKLDGCVQPQRVGDFSRFGINRVSILAILVSNRIWL